MSIRFWPRILRMSVPIVALGLAGAVATGCSIGGVPHTAEIEPNQPRPTAGTDDAEDSEAEPSDSSDSGSLDSGSLDSGSPESEPVETSDASGDEGDAPSADTPGASGGSLGPPIAVTPATAAVTPPRPAAPPAARRTSSPAATVAPSVQPQPPASPAAAPLPDPQSAEAPDATEPAVAGVDTEAEANEEGAEDNGPDAPAPSPISAPPAVPDTYPNLAAVPVRPTEIPTSEERQAALDQLETDRAGLRALGLGTPDLAGGEAPGPARVATLTFDEGSANVAAADIRVIRRVAEEQVQTDGRIRIVGHATGRPEDGVGERLRNYGVSLDRAYAVKDVLIESGVNPDQIVVEAMNDLQPLNGGQSAERAEIYLDSPVAAR